MRMMGLEQDKKRILQMVKDGKISIDEALSLLETLEDAEKKKESIQQLILYDEAKADSNESNHTSSTKTNFFNFINKAIEKMKEIEFDFHHSVDVNHVFYEKMPDINEINVDITHGSLTIYSWDQADTRVECMGKVYSEKDKEEAKRKFFEGISFQIENGILSFSSKQKLIKTDVVIYIPSAQYEKIKAKLFHGHIKCEKLTAEEWEVKTTNGHIEGRDLKGRNGEFETGNGRISIIQSDMKNLEAETVNGTIRTEGEFQELDLKTMSGKIFCTAQNDTVEKICAKTVTSSVQILLNENVEPSGELKTNLGNIDINFDGIYLTEDKKDFAQKKISFQSFTQKQHSLLLLVESKTGSILVEPLKNNW